MSAASNTRFAVPAFALAVLLVLLAPWRRPRPEALALKVERTPGAQRIRGSEAGGRIRATARGGERHRAIWVYRDARELVAVCPAAGGSAAAGAAVTSTACYRDGDALLLELGVERVGTYRVIALGAAAELPVPRGGFDGDLAAAITAGAASRQQDVEVQ